MMRFAHRYIKSVSHFAHLNYSVDIQDVDILKFVSMVDDSASKFQIFYCFSFGDWSSFNDVLNHWCNDDLNKPYRYSLHQAVDKNKYRLTEKEEQLVNLKDLTGIDALRKLYGEHASI